MLSLPSSKQVPAGSNVQPVALESGTMEHSTRMVTESSTQLVAASVMARATAPVARIVDMRRAIRIPSLEQRSAPHLRIRLYRDLRLAHKFAATIRRAGARWA